MFGEAFASKVLSLRISGTLLLRSATYLALDFPTPLVLLALVGISRAGRLRSGPVGAALIALLVVHLLWAVRYDVPDQYSFFIPSVVIIAIWIGIGADAVLGRWSRRMPVVLLGLALVPPAVYAPLPWAARAAGVSLGVRREVPYRDSYQFYLWPWKTGYRGPERFAKEIQQSLPRNAVLIGDYASHRPLHYLIATGHWRSDLVIWPPHRPRGVTGPTWPEEDQIREELQAGRVYVVSPRPLYCPRWLVENYEFEPAGVVFRVVGPKAATHPTSQ